MPVINLTIKGKQTIGDGTKIVCMNSDYVVRIAFEDCETLVNSPYKRLVVKSTLYYQEAPINEITENGTKFLQATLPAIENQSTVELGVCGRNTDNPFDKPTFSSIPAIFDCQKSILCGAVVLRKDPKLSAIEISENGKYKAIDTGADGFYEVDVFVPPMPTEARLVDLSMQMTDQVIFPSKAGHGMTAVTVKKPASLVPANIVKGANIGGVVGTFEKTFTSKKIYFDGEYTPEGFDGFNKITVNVAKSHTSRVMRVGDQFTYDYAVQVRVVAEPIGIVRHWDNGDNITIEAASTGECLVTVTELDIDGNVVNMQYYDISVNAEGDHTLPAEASSVEEMNAHLERGVVGSIIKYTGESAEGFVHGATYIVEEVE